MITTTTTAPKKFEYTKEVISIRKSKKERQYNSQKRMKLARGSVGGACVAHLSFCFEETSIDSSYQISVHLATLFQIF